MPIGDEGVQNPSDSVNPVFVTKEYDPLEDLFVAQSAKPRQLGEINLRALDPYQRALLVIDGTVTKFIETYTLEPVEIIRISMEERELPSDHVWLDAPKGTVVLAREVILHGKYSYRMHAYATSLIVRDRLPDQIRRGLEVDPGGIGRIILASRLETYREILWYGKERPEHLPPQIGYLENAEFISRTYRIIANRQPIMLINEKFPTGEDLPPFHE
jgi:chorismate-pyruvate lyase